MKNSILESQRELLDKFLSDLHSERTNGLDDKLLQKLGRMNLSIDTIDKRYQNLSEADKSVSYLRAFRIFLQEDNDLHYDDALNVISKIFEYKFDNKNEVDDNNDNINSNLRNKNNKKTGDYTYTRAIKNYNLDQQKDVVNSRAEWRAYFEFRFRKAILKFVNRHFEQYWLTTNINLFSFSNLRNLPLYRLHINVPDKSNAAINTNQSPYDMREKSFRDLGYFQGKYSFVWEIIENNVTSIFYFDKTAQSPMDMIVYEIDTDALPGNGQVDSKYTSRFNANGTHREGTILKIDQNDLNPEKVFSNERALSVQLSKSKYGQKERSFQYSIIRFLIRSGIFNPCNAAFHVRLFDPKFENLLEKAYNLYRNSLNANNFSLQNMGANRENYEKMLWNELEKIKNYNYTELEKIVLDQFESTLSDSRKPKWDLLNSKWTNFDHDEKYTKEENEDLDKIIRLFDLMTPEVLDVRLSIFETGFFYLTQENNTISHIYWLPIIINWKNQLTGGAIFLNSDKRIDANNEWKIDDATGKYEDGSTATSKELSPSDEVPQDLITLLYYFNGLFVDKQIGEIEESLRPAQERSAAVSIMSRNISHNIGSHVLSYLKNLLSSEKEMISAGVLSDLVIVEEDGGIKLNESLEGKSAMLVLPYMRSIGRLIGYFQERQDYIGTFASDRYLYFSPLYFKGGVIDYFCGNSRVVSEDENTIKFTRNLALDYIIYSEGYEHDDIVFRTLWRDSATGEVRDFDEDFDIEVALPSGNTGRQGIYTILENFIRNSAKHGAQKDLRKGHKMLIDIIVSEDIEGNNHHDYYKVEIIDNSGKVEDEKLSSIKDVLVRPLVRDDGNPDERHKGIKEIQIASGWLRGVQPHQLRDKEPTDGLMVLDVDCVERLNAGWGLKYTFYLRRPNPGLLVVKDRDKYFNFDEASRKETLKDDFINLKNWDIIEYSETIKLNSNKVPYRFILIHKDLEKSKDWKSIYFNILSQSPVRIVTGWIDEQFKIPNFLESLYEEWLNGKAVNLVNKSESRRFDLVFPPNKKPLSITGKVSDPSEDSPRIGILDMSTRRMFSNDLNIRSFVFDNEERSHLQTILFRTHNDLSTKFDAFADKYNLDDYCFIEGISGDNTTNRLLRQETITHFWRYKILEAALTKIIIIDERIWKNYQGQSQEDRERNYLRWSKKNIHILSLEHSEAEPKLLLLQDLRGETIATLDSAGKAKYTNDGYKNQYEESHFISLHQGLLERAIKHCYESLKNKTEQDQVDDLLENFKRNLLRAKFRVTVHSGRSKTHILPKRTAFVQLSSLGSALRDSKLSLCELFYSTIQENN